MKGKQNEAAKTNEAAPRVTLEDAHSGPIVVKAKKGKAAELRAESKRGRLLAMLQSARGAKQDQVEKEFGWKPRDFADAMRLLAGKNGVTAERNEKGVWHAA